MKISILALPDHTNQFAIHVTGDTLATLFETIDAIANGEKLDIEQDKLFTTLHTKLALAVLKHRLQK